MHTCIHHLGKNPFWHMQYIYIIINCWLPHRIHFIISPIIVFAHIRKNRFIINVVSEYILSNLINNLTMSVWYICKNIVSHFKKFCRFCHTTTVYTCYLICLWIHWWIYKYLYQLSRILLRQIICINIIVFMPEIIFFIIMIVIINHPGINLLFILFTDTLFLFYCFVQLKCFLCILWILSHFTDSAHNYSWIVLSIITCSLKHLCILLYIKHFFYIIINCIFSNLSVNTFKCNLAVTSIHTYICCFPWKLIYCFFCKLRISDMYISYHITKALHSVHIWHLTYKCACVITHKLCLKKCLV